MSIRRAPPADTAEVSAPLANVPQSPYLFTDEDHLSPGQYSDHDGGPWSGPVPTEPVIYRKVSKKWIFAPRLGSSAPALSLFPLRHGTNVSFTEDVHLAFSACWTPVIARFTQLFLVDVDKKGKLPRYGQEQEWMCTFRGKTSTGTTSIEIKIRLNDAGDIIEGFGVWLPDSNLVMDMSSFPAPAAARQSFHSSSAIVVNGAFKTFSPENLTVEFSTLDNRVERELRVKRGKQAWKLLTEDLAIRSQVTVKQINSIRTAVYYDYLANEKMDKNFFEVDVERAPI